MAIIEENNLPVESFWSAARRTVQAARRALIEALREPPQVRSVIAFEDVGPIQPREEVNIRSFPQVWGKVERIVIPREQGVDFVVTDIRIGITSLVCSAGETPAVVFGEQIGDESDRIVLMSEIEFLPNQPISVTVKNISSKPAFCTPGALIRLTEQPHLDDVKKRNR